MIDDFLHKPGGDLQQEAFEKGFCVRGGEEGLFDCVFYTVAI
jgi:hypothetical protein